MQTAPPDFTAIAQALDLLHPSGTALDLEARHCLAERRRPRPIAGLPEPLALSLADARARAAATALERSEAALWAAATRCCPGWELNVGWQRIEAELTAQERVDVCVNGRHGRRLQSAWCAARKRGRPPSVP